MPRHRPHFPSQTHYMSIIIENCLKYIFDRKTQAAVLIHLNCNYVLLRVCIIIVPPNEFKYKLIVVTLFT